MNTIGEIFERYVEKNPDAIALTFKNQSITYQILNKKANQVAHFLRSKGVKPDQCVALYLERSSELIIALLGIIKAGSAYLPLDITQPSNRLQLILEDNQYPIVITNPQHQTKFQDYSGSLLLMDDENLLRQPQSNLEIITKPNNLAYIIYTSGSTGRPKGVLIEHQSVINFVQWFKSFCEFQSQDRIDFSSNISFDMAVSNSIVPLLLGLHIEICDDETKKNTRWYFQHLASRQIQYIKITPGYFKVLIHEAKNNRIPLPHLKGIILGGEKLTTADCASWLAIYPEHLLFNEYGPTEATVAMTEFTVSVDNLASLGQDVPIGKPGLNIDAYILDENNAIVEDGGIGELHIAGICLSRGYSNQPDITAQKFISTEFCPRLYKSGDLAQKMPDGNIIFLGRIDEQVKIRGFRIEPGEIEYFLNQHPGVERSVILAQQNGEEEEKRLVAYYIAKTADLPDVASLRTFLQGYLPSHMIPVAYINMPAFPLTANGKLDKKAFPTAEFHTNTHYAAAETILQKKMAQIWSEELKIPNIGLEDNFFEAGGHSLLAARMISRINHLFGKDIAFSAFYQAKDLRELCILVEQSPDISQHEAQPVVDLQAELNTLPLSNFQLLVWLSNTFAPEVKTLNIITRKRLQGQLNIVALKFAFDALLKKHEVLLYQVLTFKPAQILQPNRMFSFVEKNIRNVSQKDTEILLEKSLHDMMHMPWPKNTPLLMAKLFHLKKDAIEIQIAMPHILSDGVSVEILWSDLSKFYLFYNKNSDVQQINTNTYYRDYLLKEQYRLQTAFDQDMLFWDDYLKDASLFTFPSKYIIKNMEKNKIPFSTYTQIPNATLKKLEKFCAQNHFSFSDGICAAFLLAIHRCCVKENHINKTIAMNIVKSTRDNKIYDDIIACFLRLEPVKLALQDPLLNLTTLAQQIQQSIIQTADHQPCSSLVKLTCISTFKKQTKAIRSLLVKVFSALYGKFFGLSKTDQTMIRLAERLDAKYLQNYFLININVTPMAKRKNLDNLFGLQTTNIKLPAFDLLTINNLLDVYLYFDDNQNLPYLIISANLDPAFREAIAQEFLDILNVELKAGSVVDSSSS